MRPVNQGFTIIELMMVVAIVSILAIIAIPAYIEYTSRARISEALVFADETRTTVSDYFFFHGQVWPGNNAEAGLGPRASYARKFISGIEVKANGVIWVELSFSPLTGESVIFSPDYDGHRIAWGCSGSAGIPTRFLPASCR
ncbi:MAG: pilin [Gammaproteobacteria bacterium]|nr:pilin [Gammaproteobacteria bacterium]